MAIAFKVKGLREVTGAIQNAKNEVAQQIKEVIEDAADGIVYRASKDVPVDLGALRNSIGNLPKNKGLDYTVFVGMHYAPYIEFGTGAAVEVPAELGDYAMQFKKGSGNKHLPARPFFFPAYFDEQKRAIASIRSILNKV